MFTKADRKMLDNMESMVSAQSVVARARHNLFKYEREQIKSRLAAIEQGQGVLLATLNAIDAVGDANRIESKERYENLMRLIGFQWDALSKKLDSLQGAALHAQFKAKQPKRRKK